MVMAGDMIRGTTVHGIIPGTVHTGIALIVGVSVGTGAVFMQDGVLRGIMTGTGDRHTAGAGVADITEEAAGIATITANLIIVINTGAP